MRTGRNRRESGRCYVGNRPGRVLESLTAAAIYWPDCENASNPTQAVGDEPVVGGFRGQAGRRGRQLVSPDALIVANSATFPGRVTPAGAFLEWLAELLEGEKVVSRSRGPISAKRECPTTRSIRHAGVGWPVEWRAQGSGRHGSAEDVRAFCRAVESGSLRPWRLFGFSRLPSGSPRSGTIL